MKSHILGVNNTSVYTGHYPNRATISPGFIPHERHFYTRPIYLPRTDNTENYIADKAVPNIVPETFSGKDLKANPSDNKTLKSEIDSQPVQDDLFGTEPEKVLFSPNISVVILILTCCFRLIY